MHRTTSNSKTLGRLALEVASKKRAWRTVENYALIRSCDSIRLECGQWAPSVTWNIVAICGLEYAKLSFSPLSLMVATQGILPTRLISKKRFLTAFLTRGWWCCSIFLACLWSTVCIEMISEHSVEIEDGIQDGDFLFNFFFFCWQNLVLDRLETAVTTKGNLTPGSKTCLYKSDLNEITLFWRSNEGLNLVFLEYMPRLDVTYCRLCGVINSWNLTICTSILPCVIQQQNFENQRICPTLDVSLDHSLEYSMERVLTMELFVK